LWIPHTTYHSYFERFIRAPPALSKRSSTRTQI